MYICRYKCTYFYIAASVLDTYLADIFASECKFGKVDCTCLQLSIIFDKVYCTYICKTPGKSIWSLYVSN